jgi:hypothetical protein
MASFQLVKKEPFKKNIEVEQFAFYQIMHGSSKYRVYPETHLWLPSLVQLEDRCGGLLDTESASIAVHGHAHSTACGTLYLCHMAFYTYTGKRQLDWHKRWDYLYGV